jgi:hypothetical protein
MSVAYLKSTVGPTSPLGPITKNFSSTLSAFWAGATSQSYPSSWSYLPNTSYAAGTIGGGGLASWLPQNPGTMVWNSSGNTNIPTTGKYSLTLTVMGFGGITGNSNTSVSGGSVQIGITIASAPANSTYNTSAINNNQLGLINAIATGSTNYIGEATASCVVSLVSGTVLALQIFNGTGATKTATLTVQWNVQLLEAYA